MLISRLYPHFGLENPHEILRYGLWASLVSGALEPSRDVGASRFAVFQKSAKLGPMVSYQWVLGSHQEAQMLAQQTIPKYPQVPFLWDFKHPQMIGLLYWLCHIHVFLYSICVLLCANVAFWRQVGNASFEHLLGPSCGSDLDWCRETVSPETTFFFTPKSPRVSCKLSHL